MANFDPNTLDQMADRAWDALHPAAADFAGGDLATPAPPSDAEQVDYSDFAYEMGDGSDELEAAASDSDALEAAAFESYLQQHGVNFNTATADQLEAAVEFAEQYSVESSDDEDDDDVAYAQAWLDDIGAPSLAAVEPYLEQAQAAVTAGSLTEDEALAMAGEAYQKAAAAQDDANREARYSKWDQLDAAMDDVWERAEPAGPKLYEGTSDKTAKGWEAKFDTALDKTLRQVSAKQATREAARDRARNLDW